MIVNVDEALVMICILVKSQLVLMRLAVMVYI